MSESESEEGFVVAESTEGFVDVASSSLRKRAANLLLDDKYSGRVLQPGDLSSSDDEALEGPDLDLEFVEPKPTAPLTFEDADLEEHFKTFTKPAPQRKRNREQVLSEAREVERQVKIWDTLITTWIKIEQTLKETYTLPKSGFEIPPCMKELGEINTGLMQKLHGCSQTLWKATGSSNQKRQKLNPLGEDSEASLQNDWDQMLPVFNDLIDSWQRKVNLASVSNSAQYQAINQSLSTQIGSIMDGSIDRLLVQSRRLPLKHRFIGSEPSENPELADATDDQIFGDTNFYQLLLKDFVNSKKRVDKSLEKELGKEIQKKARLKNIDRKASKGRRMRYQTIPKLCNFVAPIPEENNLIRDQLLASLFQ